MSIKFTQFRSPHAPIQFAIDCADMLCSLYSCIILKIRPRKMELQCSLYFNNGSLRRLVKVNFCIYFFIHKKLTRAPLNLNVTVVTSVDLPSRSRNCYIKLTRRAISDEIANAVAGNEEANMS